MLFRSSSVGASRTKKRIARLAQACLWVAGGGLIIASLVWYRPDLIPIDASVFPFMRFSALMSQLIYFGGVALAIALLAWISPAPAAVIGILLSAYRIIRFTSFATLAPLPITRASGEVLTPMPTDVRFIPQAVYYLLYGLFITGCAELLVQGINQLWKQRKVAPVERTSLRLAARVITTAALALSVIAFLTVGETSAAFTFNVLAIIACSIAWFWQGTGSILILLLSLWSFYDLWNHGYGTGAKLVYSGLFLCFMTGGFLYLLFALREKMLTVSDSHTPAIRREGL